MYPAASFRPSARPTMPPTNALTTISSVNCGQFARSPNRTVGVAAAWLAGCSARAAELTGGQRWDGAGHVRCSPAGLQRSAVRGGPVFRPSDGDGHVLVAIAGEEAGGGHRPLPVAAHEGEWLAAR